MSDSRDFLELPPQNGEDDNVKQEEKEDDEEEEKEQEEEEATNQEANLVHLDHVESREDLFEDANEDIQENQFQEVEETTANEYREESNTLALEVVDLRRKLKTLRGKQHDGVDQEETMVPATGGSLREMISDCSELVDYVSEDRAQRESVISELGRQIEDLEAKVQAEQTVGVIADRILGSLSMVVGQGEMLDYSVVGKVAHVERCTSLLLEHYNWFLYETDQLRQCLAEGGVNVLGQEEFGLGSVFATARGELMELKKREGEMAEKISHLEEESRKLVEKIEKEKAMMNTVNAEIGKMKMELEQEKNRCTNTKEKLSMAVTKGKALVQQRDSLKQSLAEKTNELEKCLAELQDKSTAAEDAKLCKGELVKCESLVASLQESLSQRNAIVESLEEIFSQTSVPDELQSLDITKRLNWLVNTVASLQEKLSHNNLIFENLEEILAQSSIPDEIKSTNVVERSKWLVKYVASVQETLSERTKILDSLEDILFEISAPAGHEWRDSVERLKWVVEERNALKDNLLEFHKLKDALSLIDLPETVSSSDLEARIGWLKESVNQAKVEISMLQDEIARIKESAHNEIDSLTASLSAELQKKEFIRAELNDLQHRYGVIVEREHQASLEKDQIVRMLLEGSGIVTDNPEGACETFADVAMLIDKCFWKMKEQNSVSLVTSPADTEEFEEMKCLLYVKHVELMLCGKLLEEDMAVRSEVSNLSKGLRVASLELSTLKEENDSLQKELNRSEEKSALVREKLSMAVKKGKGLFQDRESLKLSLGEKDSEIEKLKLELQQQESTAAECRDQINRLSAHAEQIPRLEADLVAMKDQRDQFEQFLSESNNLLQRVIESVDRIVLPVDSVFEEPVDKVNWISKYVDECQQAKTLAEQELEKVKEETSSLSSKLAEVEQNMKVLEDALLASEGHISQLAKEKRGIEVAKENLEQDLQRAIDEATAQTRKFSESRATSKSLEDALSLAENNISLLVKEREEAQLGRAAAKTELDTVREEVATQTSKLTEAYITIKSLEDALSQAEANVSLLTEQSNHSQIGRTDLENVLTKLKDEADSQAGKLADASRTILSLEDALSKAGNDITALENEKMISEQEISTLNSKLKACMDELASTNRTLESRSVELLHQIGDFRMHIKNESLLFSFRRCFEKEFENLKNMHLIVKDMRSNLVDTGLELLQSHHAMEEDSHMMNSFPHDLGNSVNSEMYNGEENAADVDDISLYLKKIVEEFHLRNKVLMDNFEGLFVFMDGLSEALLRKLTATKDAVVIITEHMDNMKQNMKNMEIHNKEQEKTIAMLAEDCEVLLSACASATRELQFEVKNKLLEMTSIPELQKLNHKLIREVSEVSMDNGEHQQMLDGHKCEMAEKLLLATRKIQTLIKLFDSTSNVVATTIEDLQKKVEDIGAASERAIEEKCQVQNRVSQLETDIKALECSSEELRLQVEYYQDIEEKLKEREAELSTLHANLLTKEQEAEDPLMSATQLKTLFDKIRRVEISSTESQKRDMDLHGSDDVQKLFYIVESVTGLQHQINVLSHDRDTLQSTVSTQALEIEHLKEEIETSIRNKQDLRSEMSELTIGLEKIVDMLGGNEIAGDRKSAGVQGLLLVLEKQIMTLLLEAENSKSQAQELGTKLLGNQKVIDELSTKMKLLEDSLESRTAQSEIVQERSIFEAPSSLPTGSEISEIEDGSVGKPAVPPIPSAAHVRTMRKGSTDHLALNIDVESSSLLNNKEADEDKGHVFKSLNTSGLIPKQGKSLADRIDGIWVSGGRVLMSRPRARLGFIAYWLLLHIWLLTTVL